MALEGRNSKKEITVALSDHIIEKDTEKEKLVFRETNEEITLDQSSSPSGSKQLAAIIEV